MPKGKSGGASASIVSSSKMYCCAADQPGPPNSFGQLGADQPCSAKIRVQRMKSSLGRCSQAISLARFLMSGGSRSRRKARTASRKRLSALEKR